MLQILWKWYTNIFDDTAVRMFGCQNLVTICYKREKPCFCLSANGKLHDVNILDELVPQPGPSASWIAAISISEGFID